MQVLWKGVMDIILICKCQNPNHQIYFNYNKKYNELYTFIHLTPFKFWKRVKVAFQYLIGKTVDFGHFEEILFKSEDSEKFIEIANILKGKNE